MFADDTLFLEDNGTTPKSESSFLRGSLVKGAPQHRVRDMYILWPSTVYGQDIREIKGQRSAMTAFVHTRASTTFSVLEIWWKASLTG